MTAHHSAGIDFGERSESITSVMMWGKHLNWGKSTIVPIKSDNRLAQLSNKVAYEMNDVPFRSKKHRRLWRRFVSLQMKIAAKRRASTPV